MLEFLRLPCKTPRASVSDPLRTEKSASPFPAWKTVRVSNEQTSSTDR